MKDEIAGRHDFDFFIGDWRVRHRRLKERLADSHEWIEFEGTTSMRKILGGLGNTDDNMIDLPGNGYRAVTLRAYDLAKKQWLIWWLDSRMPGGPLDPPVAGHFENGVGTFYSDGTFNDRPIRVRFLWTQSNTPHWEQAFSVDGGKTWETNWTMDFQRDIGKHTQTATGPADQHDFDFLVGQWRVQHRYLRVKENHREWLEVDGTMSNSALMNGRANLEEHTINAPSGAYLAAALRSYDPKTSQWSIWWLDGRAPHSNLDPPVQGRFENGAGTFQGDTMIDGKPTRVRFLWERVASTTPHWEQAYSVDEGKTWETNWTMDFTKIP